MKVNAVFSVALVSLLAACGGGSTTEEVTAQDPQKIAFRIDNSNTVEFPIGEPIAVTLLPGLRIHVTTASPVTWSIRYPGGLTQGTGNIVRNAGVTIVEESSNNPSQTWSATVSGRTPSLGTLAFELVVQTQPQAVIQFYMAQ